MRKVHFNLTELILVSGILILFCALLSSSQLSRDRGEECGGRLKNLGSAFERYAADHNGEITGKIYNLAGWNVILAGTDADNKLANGKTVTDAEFAGTGYIPRDDNFESTRCPGLPAVKGKPAFMQAYGMSINETYGTNGNVSAKRRVFRDTPRADLNKSSFYVRPAEVADPSAFMLLADSAYINWKSQYADVNWHGTGTGYALRHKGKAQVLFADGHVGALAPEEIVETLNGYCVNFNASPKVAFVDDAFRLTRIDRKK